MFRIENVKDGWWNSIVGIVAEERIIHEEKRIRYSGRFVARIETWRLVIEEGDRFEIKLPRSVEAKAGNRIGIKPIMLDRPFKRNWSRISSF